MSVSLKDKIAKLPKKRRGKIELRTQELIHEELTLRNIREMFGISQEDLAIKLDVHQSSISRLENRPNITIQTLFTAVKAIGGEVDIIVTLPNKQSVKLSTGSLRTIPNKIN